MTTKAMVKIPTFWIFLTLFGAMTAMGGKILSDTQDDIDVNTSGVGGNREEIIQLQKDNAVSDAKYSAILSDLQEIKEGLKELRR